MKEKIKLLEKELKYLTKEAKQMEIEKNINRLDSEEIRNIANDIYISRGLDISKLKRNFTSNMINDFSNIFSNYKNKDKYTKKKIVIDIIYYIIILLFLKIPFDFVRDIGYEYIEMLTTNNALFTVWNLVFLLLYTITLICTALVLIRNFNNKYSK